MTFNADALPVALAMVATAGGLWWGRWWLQRANQRDGGVSIPDRWVSPAAAGGVVVAVLLAGTILFLPFD